jgi:hypothetical protein
LEQADRPDQATVAQNVASGRRTIGSGADCVMV